MHLVLLLLLAICCSSAAASGGDVVSYSYPAFDGNVADGLLVATRSSILAPATFLFDAQLFPNFNDSEGFLLLSETVELWRANASPGGMSPTLEASFNTSFTVDDASSPSTVAFVVLLDSLPPLASPGGHRGDPSSVTGVAMANATGNLATVEVGTVKSYGPRSPDVGLNVTISLNRTAPTPGLTVWIEYDAVVHHLSLYVTAAGEARPLRAILDAPLNLAAGSRTTQSAFVGFFADAVRDAVVGIRDWDLTVDRFPGDGRQRQQGKPATEERVLSSRLVALIAVLGSVVVISMVASVVVCYVVSRRRALEMERIRQYTSKYLGTGGRLNVPSEQNENC